MAGACDCRNTVDSKASVIFLNLDQQGQLTRKELDLRVSGRRHRSSGGIRAGIQVVAGEADGDYCDSVGFVLRNTEIKLKQREVISRFVLSSSWAVLASLAGAD